MAVKDWFKDYFKETGDINKRRLKKLVLSAPFWILSAAVILIAAGCIRYAVLTGNRSDTRMASVWSQGSQVAYRHVVVYAKGSRAEGDRSPFGYIDQDVSLGRTEILSIRTALQNVVDSQDKAKKNKGLSDNGRPVGWEDCFSSFLNADVSTVSSDANAMIGTTEAQIVAVDGNFKAFHPFEYLSGGFLPEVIVDQDQIVLNDVLAWRFFNSYDVVGTRVSIFGHEFVISGVVRESSDSISKTSGTDSPRAYIYFSALEKYYVPADQSDTGDLESVESVESDAAVIAPELGACCYEAMLPELVNNVSVTDVKTALPNYNAADPKLYVMTPTGSLNVYKVWKYMVPIGATDKMIDGFEFPYWGKALQLTIRHLFVDIILVAAGLVLLFIGIVTAVLRGKKFAKNNIVDPPAKTEEGDEGPN
ncbi:MAG TPA: hypothetical protein DCW41_01735 [Clostridiales bacterium]|nr:hypothetical protein [Clostridiales bacterium]